MQSDTGTADGGPKATLSTADIVERVAQETGVDVLDLEPIYEAVDPDALDALLATSTTALEVTFQYDGRLVTVHGDGRVDVEYPPMR